ncbi:MAG TPA: sigma-70 family RNA polymerase sigma factor [Verrucomicrobiae bacterium]|nr:sigma-70 family RNA polymerase sigma factor [Verrucomicrobiae bacterium]
MPKRQRLNDEQIRTRASLLIRLKNLDDDKSWHDFFETYWKLIYRVARQVSLTDAEAQDVVQETMVHLAKKMPAFNYDPAIGSFKSWLLIKVRWASIEQLRKRGRFQADAATSDETHTRLIDNVPDPVSLVPEQVWEEQWKNHLLEMATTNIQSRVHPRSYQLYDYYVNKGWPTDKITVAFGVSVEVVHTAKHRVMMMIAQEVKRLERVHQ